MFLFAHNCRLAIADPTSLNYTCLFKQINSIIQLESSVCYSCFFHFTLGCAIFRNYEPSVIVILIDVNLVHLSLIQLIQILV